MDFIDQSSKTMIESMGFDHYVYQIVEMLNPSIYDHGHTRLIYQIYQSIKAQS